jgi:hypothetical protein
MVTLQSPGGATVRLPEADAYPGYEGWSISAAEDWPTLEMLKADAWEQVKAIRTAKETGTCDTPVGFVQIDDASKLKITGALSLCRLQEEQGQAFSLRFTLADNSNILLDGASMRQLAGAVGAYVAAVYDHASALRDAIAGAPDAASLAGIDLEAGWP